MSNDGSTVISKLRIELLESHQVKWLVEGPATPKNPVQD